MIRFEAELQRFNDSLKQGVWALEREHDRVDGIWRDDFRKQYDARWKAFGDHAKRYTSNEAQRYSAFIRSKIQRVAQYLHG